jgi:hypothetical protein
VGVDSLTPHICATPARSDVRPVAEGYALPKTRLARSSEIAPKIAVVSVVLRAPEKRRRTRVFRTLDMQKRLKYSVNVQVVGCELIVRFLEVWDVQIRQLTRELTVL